MILEYFFIYVVLVCCCLAMGGLDFCGGDGVEMV
jgi:hypothetical protein